MIKIEEKEVKVLFAKGENGTILVGANDKSVTLKPIIDYVKVGDKEVPSEMVGDKKVVLEFSNIESVNIMIKALLAVRQNIIISNDTLPLCC